MIEVKAPSEKYYSAIPFRPSIFLAGSIEQGTAEDWQRKVSSEMADIDCVLYNPRRDNWDDSWEQSIENEEFRNQVNWELNRIEEADLVVFYFDENTKSPITLYELGYAIGIEKDILVCSPGNFWRKGNIEVILSRLPYDIEIIDDFDDFIEEIKIWCETK